MTLKFFLGIRIDSNRIESNHFKIRFDSIRSEPYLQIYEFDLMEPNLMQLPNTFLWG